jgi:hypothetical protein
MWHEVTFAVLVRFVATCDEVNANPSAARQVIQSGGHSSEHNWLNKTGSMGDHDLEPFRSV